MRLRTSLEGRKASDLNLIREEKVSACKKDLLFL